MTGNYILGGETFESSLGRGAYWTIGSRVLPDGIVPVEIRFSNEMVSRCQVFRVDRSYHSVGVGTFPGSAWDISDPVTPRRLNICFAERDDGDGPIPEPNYIWDPDTTSGAPGWGKSEYVYIMQSTYDSTGTIYSGAVLFSDTLDVIYAWYPRLLPGHSLLESLPASLVVQTYSETIAGPHAWRDDGALTLTWDYCGSGEHRGFRIHNAIGSLPTTVIDSTGPDERSYLHAPLTNGLTHFYRIEIIGPDGEQAGISRLFTGVPYPSSASACLYQYNYSDPRERDDWTGGRSLTASYHGGISEHWTRFETFGEDTLQSVEFKLWDIFDIGTPTVRICLYEASTNAVSPACGLPVPGDLRGCVDVPYSELYSYPHSPTVADLSSIPVAARVFGTSGSLIPENYFVSIGLSPLTPDPETDQTAIVYSNDVENPDEPVCLPDPRSGSFFPDYDSTGQAEHRYMGEYTCCGDVYRQAEYWMDAYVCTSDPNQCPVITGFENDPVTAMAGRRIANATHATDTPGDIVGYAIGAGPGAVDPESGEWQYTPTCDDVPGFDVTISASDRGIDECLSASFAVDVAPSALVVPCADIEVYAGEAAVKQVAAFGGCPSYTYAHTGGPGVLVENDLGALWYWDTDSLDIGTHAVQVLVEDGYGQQTTCAFDVIVSKIPVCACPCLGNPRCETEFAVVNIIDITDFIEVAFREALPIFDPDCPVSRTDVDCNDVTDILDLVRAVDVIFRGADPTSHYCNPCGP
ncbi:MAG TPA: hypothetical protein VM118_14165 [Acidobacteriota bacterium]|nr:hypothetical protein [Acidobacteriota bacterium]